LNIGCPETAKITKMAIDVLETQNLSRKAIDSVFRLESDVRDEKLGECNRLFYWAGTENVRGRLADFVKANKNEIQP